MTYLPPQIEPKIQTVYGLMKDGTAFDTSILTNVTSLATGFTEPLTRMQEVASFFQVPDLPDPTDLITQAGTVLPAFGTHVTNQFANLPTNLNLAASATALSQSLSGLGSDTTNMCGGIDDVFGSIIGAGQGLLDTVTGALGGITSIISNAGSMALGAVNDLITKALAGTPLGGLTSAVQAIMAQAGGGLLGSFDQLLSLANAGLGAAVQSLIAPALGTIQGLFGGIGGLFSEMTGAFSGLTSMIASEAAALTGMTSQLLTMAGAGILSSLFNHPCASKVLGAVGSSGLKGALGL